MSAARKMITTTDKQDNDASYTLSPACLA